MLSGSRWIRPIERNATALVGQDGRIPGDDGVGLPRRCAHEFCFPCGRGSPELRSIRWQQWESVDPGRLSTVALCSEGHSGTCRTPNLAGLQPNSQWSSEGGAIIVVGGGGGISNDQGRSGREAADLVDTSWGVSGVGGVNRRRVRSVSVCKKNAIPPSCCSPAHGHPQEQTSRRTAHEAPPTPQAIHRHPAALVASDRADLSADDAPDAPWPAPSGPGCRCQEGCSGRSLARCTSGNTKGCPCWVGQGGQPLAGRRCLAA